MGEGPTRFGPRTETLEREPEEIPSEAVPDTMRRDVEPALDAKLDSQDVPKTRPLTSSDGVNIEVQEPGDFPVVERLNYAVGDEFARGGLGRILEAQDRRLGRTVALKELLSKDARAQARFIREAKITARLEHPNIVPIHEAGHWPEGPRFYAMKLVRGTTLSSRLEEAVTDEERLRLVPHLIDVADAVAYAHSQGILHRDLKPSNVMVGPFGETVLIDWGLAKDLHDDEADLPSSHDGMSPSIFETSDGIVVGTPPYMPPEQAMAQPLDERADVYALGAMLYHILCGRRPYHDTHPRDILAKVVRGPPIPLEDLTYDLPPDLLAIVDKAMARSPGDRYPSAEEMAEELRRFTAGRLVRAHQYTSVELLSRFVRRNLGIVLTACVALIGLLSLGSWSYVQISQERDLARRNARQAQDEVKKFTLEKARVLLASDPTDALAWLKRLPPRTPQAASVAAEADDLGVARMVLDGHTDSVNQVAISPDGQWGASVGDDRTLRVWNLTTGEATVFTGHTEKVTQVAFGPRGRWLATGSHDRTVRLWRFAPDSRPVADILPSPKVLVGPTGPIKALVFDPSAARIAAACEDGVVVVWSLQGVRLHIFRSEGRGRNPALAFVSPRPARDPARWLAVAGFGASVRLWSLDAASHRRLEGPTERTAALAVSPDGRSIAAGETEGPMRIWSLDDGEARILPGRPDRWTAVAYAPDGRRLAAGGLDQVIRVWQVDTDRPARRLSGHQERIADLEFSPSGAALWSASWDGTVHAWTGFGEGPGVADRVLMGHSNAVSGLALSGDGRRLVSGGWDQTLRLWTVRPNRQGLLRGHTVGVHGVEFGPQGKVLVSGGHDNQVRVWDLEAGDPDTTEPKVLVGHEDHVFRVRVSPDGRWAASSSDDQTVRLWNLQTGAARVLAGHQADVEEIAFSPDGRWLVSAGEDAMAWLWSVPDGKGRPLSGHANDVTDVAFHPDGQRLATSSRDGTVRLWSVDGRLERRLRPSDREAWSVSYAPDGKTIAVASADGQVRLFETGSGDLLKAYEDLGEARLARFSPDGAFIAVATSVHGLFLCRRAFDFCDRLVGHDATVHDLTFSPDSRALVTGAGDSTVRVFDVETTESRVYAGHAAPIFDVDISPDGRTIASASADADVRLWPLRLPPKPERLAEWIAERTREVVE